MLRQALEGRDHLQQQQQESADESARLLPLQQHGAESSSNDGREERSTSSGLLAPSANAGTYGTSLPATSLNVNDGRFQEAEEAEDEEDDDDSSYDEEDDDDDDEEWSYHERQPEPQPGVARRAWNAIRGLFLLVANVENLWDSPVSCAGDGAYTDGHHLSPASGLSHQHTRAHDQLRQYQHQGYYNTNGSQRDHLHPSYPQGTSSNDNNAGSVTFPTNTAAFRRRSYFVVLFWFFILAGSYAAERSTFKLLVDRAGPFRLFSVEMVTGSHATMLGVWMIMTKCYRARKGSNNNNFHDDTIPLGVPLIDVGYMALLDTMHLLMVFLTGRSVCPTLSVILVQFTLPLSALLTQFVRSDGRCGHFCCSNAEDEDDGDGEGCGGDNAADEENRGIRSYPRSSADTSTSASDNQSNAASEGIPLPGWGGLSVEHLWGSLILTLAVVLALLPSLYTIIDPAFFVYADSVPIKTAYNTLLYVSSCFPAAASQLYKEHVFLQNKQPVNATHLNFLLSLFQFILATVMTPLVFGLQGLGAGEDWTSLYPSSHFSKNFLSGLECFLGLLPKESAENDFPEVAECHLSFLLVLGHAFSIITVGCAVDKIINAGATKAMYRGISAGIIVAVLLMYEYDMHIPEFNYGPVIDALNVVCLILLVIGAEVYHRVSLSDSVFETIYPVLDLYEYEEQ